MTDHHLSPGTSSSSSEPQASEQPVVFYACKYTPIELLAGFGATARLAETDASDAYEADRLSHVNLCGYGRGLIERLLAPDVHEVVLVTCCDVVRRVYDILKDQGKLDFLYLLDLPHRNRPADRQLFRARLADLATRYQVYSGRSFDVAAALASFAVPVPRSDRRITVLGAHASASLIETIGEGTRLPVENLTCTGQRLLASPPPALARVASPASCTSCEPSDSSLPEISPSGDSGRSGASLESFLDWYANALLDQMPCMRMEDVSPRSKLTSLPGEQGIIYHTMKFCDYYGFEYAQLLRQDSLMPLVKIETDNTRQSSGQLSTRLEAFAETLRGGSMIDEQDVALISPAPNHNLGPVYVMGIDSGSTSTDVAIVDAEGSLISTAIVPTGAKATESAQKAMQEALHKAELTLDGIRLSVATGYGRENVPDVDAKVTEITCHARGAHYLMPTAKTVIDIGGQDSKVIHLKDNGEVESFVMNDKCAAGTGRFMEMMARTLEMPLEEFCEEGLSWKHEVKISSMCTVFAESEVVSLVAQNTPTPDIIHGLDCSVASKTASLARRVHGEPPYLMTGGVAHNQGVVEALSETLGAEISTNADSQLCGAIGAALIGLDSLKAN